MSTIEPKTKVLEDGDAALIEGNTEAEIVSEGDEEVVSLAELTGEKPAPAAEPAAPAAPVAPKPAPAAQKPAPAPVDEDAALPPELRGKTRAEIAEMFRNAQSTIGRQGSELSKFRRYADVMLQRQRQQPQQPKAPQQPAEPITDEAIFKAPSEAINRLIESHPAIQEMRRTLGNAQADAAVQRATESKQRFDSAHPDAKQILSDPEFRTWVQASPIRMRMLVAADRNYNFEMGDELFGTWKALRKVQKPSEVAATGVQATQSPPAAAGAPSDAEVKSAAATLARAKAAKNSKESAANAAAVPTAGGSGGKPTGSKKVYRRADLIELQITNPDRYEAMEPEIQAAYREGRVR